MYKAILSDPSCYLTKPIKIHDLIAAINLCIQRKEVQTFSFKDGHDIVYIDYNDILYLNADGNYLHIYTKGKKYTIRQTLAVALNNLPENIFKQTHRSFIININKITRKSKGKVFLSEIVVPLSIKNDKMSFFNV